MKVIHKMKPWNTSLLCKETTKLHLVEVGFCPQLLVKMYCHSDLKRFKHDDVTYDYKCPSIFSPYFSSLHAQMQLLSPFESCRTKSCIHKKIKSYLFPATPTSKSAS